MCDYVLLKYIILFRDTQRHQIWLYGVLVCLDVLKWAFALCFFAGLGLSSCFHSITRSFLIHLWFVNIRVNANVKLARIDIPFFPVCLFLSVIHFIQYSFLLYTSIYLDIKCNLVIYLLSTFVYQDRALPFQWCQDIPWKGYQVHSFRFTGTYKILC